MNYKEAKSPDDAFLIRSGKIFIWGEIDEESSEKFVRNIRYAISKGMKEIYVYISSYGGDVDCACAIIDEINGAKKLGINVSIVALGKAYSAAAYILTFGSEKYATENTTIMFHPILFALDLDYVAAQKSYTIFSDKKYRDLITSVAKNCGYKTKKDIESFMSSIKDGMWLDVKMAISQNVIDDVWDYSWEKQSKQ